MAAPKKLVIWALNNTLTDTLGVWAASTSAALDGLVDMLGLPEKEFFKAVQAAPRQLRYGDLGQMLKTLCRDGHMGAETTPYNAVMIFSGFHKRWMAAQKQDTVLYDGALQALRLIKSSGAAQIIDSDTEITTIIRRLWLLSHNARLQGKLQKETDFLALFDQIYCLPVTTDDTSLFDDVPASFIHEAHKKITVWRTGNRKPDAERTHLILRNFNVPAANVLYVGNTVNDGLTAKASGIDFVWFAGGCDTSPETIKQARRLAPHHNYGIKQIWKDFRKISLVPDYAVLENLPEIACAFQFARGAVFTPDDSNRHKSASDRTDAGRAAPDHYTRWNHPLPTPPRTAPPGSSSPLPPKP